MTAEEFLESWRDDHVPSGVEPALRVGRAKSLARRCRADAAAAGLPDEDLTLAAQGNLVSYFEDALLFRGDGGG